MNVFHIPSWYPSQDHPLAGVFIQEQIQALAAAYPNHQFGISLWGQREEAKLLWARDTFRNISKLIAFLSATASEKEISPNLQEYYTPALSWTESLFAGNRKAIIQANEQNLLRFQQNAGAPDLIHAHVSYPAGYIAYCLAKKFKLPYLITEHMSPFPLPDYEKRVRIKGAINTAMTEAKFVIAVSPAAARDIQQKTSCTPAVIPNLVDEQLFNLAPAPEHQAAFTFFSLGRMVPQKGFPDLLRAIAMMQHQHAIFKIGGKGPKASAYQLLAQKLGISDRVQWLGPLSRAAVAREMQNSHAFVLASLHESMGVVFAEALACGRPIVTTRCGGPEYLVNQENGFLVPVAAPEKLAAALDAMIAHYEQFKPAKIRSTYLAQFSTAQLCNKVVSLYQEALQ